MPWATTRHDKDATYADVLRLQSVPRRRRAGDNNAMHGQPLRTMGGQKQQQRCIRSPDYVWQRNTRTGINDTGYGKKRQVQDDSRRTNATGIVFMLGRARTNKPGQGSKEVGIYVPADVDDKDNAI